MGGGGDFRRTVTARVAEAAHSRLSVVRNRDIVEKFVKGKTLRQLVLEYLMTERAIQKILAECGASQEDRQAALF
jgi:Mor family transcriptional regulator